MKPTEMLANEHEHILKVVNALIRECSKDTQNINKEFFEGAIDFIRNYADKFHHAKEEDILFKELCRDDVQMHCNPTEQMLYEHDLGRGFVKGMSYGIKENNRKKVVDNALSYANLLQEHIYKENNILYSMADEALDEKTQKKMLQMFKKAEAERFAKGVKEKYIELASEFERR